MTDKQFALQSIEELPDSASLSQIIDTLIVRQRIADGLEDMREGRVVSDEEAGRLIAQWLR